MWGKELSTLSGIWELIVFIAGLEARVVMNPVFEIGKLPYAVSTLIHKRHERAGMTVLGSVTCTHDVSPA